MVNKLYLIVYPENARKPVPTHWSLFLTSDQNIKQGTTYKALGTPFTGYQVDINPNHDLSLEIKKYLTVFIASLNGSGEQLATMANEVKAPGISENPLDPFAGRNCQSWAADFIGYMIEKGAVAAEARGNLAAAPKV
ncbi:hypothetical protein QBC38DRAFT_518191 [Podospora fimiseda]|uniref:Uncharacterized protein n=1 Tax=Podospora fimiseda TaxID=252190 RepID=A0AAN7BGS8_9PEZI|nr:hypothetical protein QBC38DRAFT_518191 [Podospora fimiseda]